MKGTKYDSFYHKIMLYSINNIYSNILTTYFNEPQFDHYLFNMNVPTELCLHCMLSGKVDIHKQITVKLYFEICFIKTHLNGQAE